MNKWYHTRKEDTAPLTVRPDPETTYVDRTVARRVIKFINQLKHTSGKSGGHPFNLRRWQRRYLIQVLATKDKETGLRTYRESFFFIPRKNGKALSLDTPIPTPNGWTTMGDLKDGDQVYSGDGYICNVIHAFEVLDSPDSYEVEFSNGEKIKACADHKWTIHTKDDRSNRRPGRVLSTKELIPILKQGKEYNLAIERMKTPLDSKDVDLPIDPYLLGLWLGDGSSASAEITTGDQPIADFLAALGVKRQPKSVVFTGSVPGLFRDLKESNLLKNKHIPEQYFNGSKNQRLQLLRGLMDSDGYIGGKYAQAEFCNTNRDLAYGVWRLVSSFGYKANLIEGRATLNGTDHGPKYRVLFNPDSSCNPFKLERKASKVPSKNGRRDRYLTIRSINRIDPVPMRCIAVDSDDNTFIAGHGCVRTHNSELIAAVALFFLFCEPEIGQQIIIAAATRDQASLLYRAAKSMVLTNKILTDKSKVIDSQKRIIYGKTNSVLHVISADANVQHGLNASLVIIDELHTQRNHELYDVLKTSMGARHQPLMITISTAGTKRHGICYDTYNYSKKLIDGTLKNGKFLPVIYTMEEGEDWTNEENWFKANPALGDFRLIEEMRESFQKAKDMVSFQPAFKTLYLNQWADSAMTWIDHDKWSEGSVKKPPVEDLETIPCYLGVDLSTTKDLTAIALAWPLPSGQIYLETRLYLPSDTIRERSKSEGIPYHVWAEQGHIHTIEGPTIDQNVLFSDIMELGSKYNIREISFDPFNAIQLITDLDAEGHVLSKTRQGFLTMSPLCKEFERLVLEKKLLHLDNPVLDWNLSNLMMDIDPAGNIKPSKARSGDKIDGIVAAIMAVGRAITQLDDGNSVYDGGGLKFI